MYYDNFTKVLKDKIELYYLRLLDSTWSGRRLLEGKLWKVKHVHNKP